MKMKPFACADRGAAAVEFALTAPAFFAIVFAIFYVGWTALDINTVHFAVMDAARALQINPKLTQDQLQAMVTSRVSGLSGGSGVTVRLTVGQSVNGTQVDTAVASYPLSITVPLVGTYSYSFTTSANVVVYGS